MHIIKTLAVNTFFVWRMFQRQELLEAAQAFCSLDVYRNLLNNIPVTADFMFDFSQELLCHEAVIKTDEDESRTAEEVWIRMKRRGS